MIIIFWFIMIIMLSAAILIAIFPLLKSEQVVAFIIVGIMPVIALLLYVHWGSSQALMHYWSLKNKTKIIKSELAKIKKPDQIINPLVTYLHAHSDKPKGWYLLGRLYMGQKKYAQAKNAFNVAYHLRPNNAEYTIAYSQAVFFENSHRLTLEIQKRLQLIIKHTPNSIAAINLLALDAFERRHYHQATKYWITLLPLFPAGSKDSTMLLSMIAKAQRHMNHLKPKRKQ